MNLKIHLRISQKHNDRNDLWSKHENTERKGTTVICPFLRIDETFDSIASIDELLTTSK